MADGSGGVGTILVLKLATPINLRLESQARMTVVRPGLYILTVNGNRTLIVVPDELAIASGILTRVSIRILSIHPSIAVDSNDWNIVKN